MSTPITVEARSVTLTPLDAASAPDATPEATPEVTPQPEPVYLSLTTLRQLGSCSEYIRKHGRLFPRREYPKGPQINLETCEKHARNFDWSWGVSHMLNHEGNRAYNSLIYSSTSEHTALFGRLSNNGPGLTRMARVFGHLFANHPEYRSDAYQNAILTEKDRADEYALRDLRETKMQLENVIQEQRYLADRVKSYANQEKELRQSIAELEEQTVGARRRQAEREVRQIEQELETLKAGIKRVEERRAEKIKTVEELAASEPTAEPATAPAE